MARDSLNECLVCYNDLKIPLGQALLLMQKAYRRTDDPVLEDLLTKIEHRIKIVQAKLRIKARNGR